MSPSSSHPISLAEYETTETTIDAECLTTSTAGEPNGHTDDVCDAKNSKKCRSCKRCGSIGSNKSEIVSVHRNAEFSYDQSPSLVRRKCCASSSRIDAIVDLDDCPLASSRRPSMCSLRHGISTTSLNCRSSTRSICSKHGKSEHPRHQRRSQSHHRHERCHMRQYSHQHIANGSPQMVPFSDHTIPRSCCRHRRRISCSSHSGESIHYRKRIDSETSSFYGSESSVYEPNHAEGGASSTNTVVLTPTKITIEHKEESRMQEYANGITPANRNKYVASPTHWNFLTEDYDENQVNGKNGVADATQYDEYSHRGGNEKKGALRKHYHRKSTPTHSRQRSDPDMHSDAIGTIIFHHKGEASGNCCEAYYQCSEATVGANVEGAASCDADFGSKKVEPQEVALNNANTVSQSEATHLNFHKNDISSMMEKPLNLLPDLRRYSKITNLETQNASNLTPNYFQSAELPGSSQAFGSSSCDRKFNTFRNALAMSASSQNNQMQSMHASSMMPSNQPPGSSAEFELLDLATPSAFQKPFGSIHLTAQNDFEPFSHTQSRARSNASTLPSSMSLDHLHRIAFSSDENNERVNYRNATSSESLVTMADARDGITTVTNQQTRRISRLINTIRKRARKYIKKN